MMGSIVTNTLAILMPCEKSCRSASTPPDALAIVEVVRALAVTTILRRICCSVILSKSLSRIIGQYQLFHAPTMVKSVNVAISGFCSGSRMRTNIWISFAPSMQAASSSERISSYPFS